MAAPIPPMLKYSVVYNLLNCPPIVIKFESKLIVCKVLYFKAQYFLRLRSPLIIKINFVQRPVVLKTSLLFIKSLNKTETVIV